MRRERIEVDQAFFAERIAGRPSGQRRSLPRARALAPHLGVDLEAWRTHPERVVTVVGSKGKGTAATFASAALAAGGLRVGTLTSPGLRSNRERIRVDGAAIPRPDYEALVTRVASTLRRVSGSLPDDGYLSPSGLFTLSALRHFADRGCEVVVLEAGMGGGSDEVSLVAPAVVVVTPVLAEHLGVLGDSVGAIAAEKAGVVTDATREVVAAPQPDPAAGAAIREAARAHGCGYHADGEESRPEAADRQSPRAPGLGALNARLGLTAASLLLAARGAPAPQPAVLEEVLGSVRLPGRLSHHRRGDQVWIVDCATNPVAIAAALDHTAATAGPPSSVLTFIPRHRDAAPLLEALRGQPLIAVPGGPPARVPGTGAVMRLEALDLDALGPRVVALGPVYFAGEVLATLGVDCERSFSPPSPPPGRARTRRG
jgi:dihydrofolate synthase/folylpolyglutamate synthase